MASLFDALFSNRRRLLLGILLLAFVARLFFVFVGATIYYGEGGEFIHGDSFSYMGFKHLWEHGVYTFNPDHRDAFFGRVPTYPFFWGLHYLIFGDEPHLAVAISQCLLDVASTWMIFRLTERLTDKLAPAALAAALYAAYPFAIVWVSVTHTETFTTFIGLATLALVVLPKPRLSTALLAGAVGGLALLAREHLGVLLLAGPLYYVLSGARDGSGSRHRWQRALVFAVAFVMTYSVWPLRNWINHDRIVLLRPSSTGYYEYEYDIHGARAWAVSWTNFSNPWLAGMSGASDHPPFPEHVVADAEEAAEAHRLIAKGQRCGIGFNAWAAQSREEATRECTDEVGEGFLALKESYVARNRLRYWTEVPAQNLWKSVFKSSLVEGNGGGWRSLAVRGLFGWRTLLVLLGWLGVLLYWRRPLIATIAVIAGAHYVFFCVVMRMLEMRYLLQADTLLLIPAAMVVWAGWERWGWRRRRGEDRHG